MNQSTGTQWMSWQEVPWISGRDPLATTLQLCDRILIDSSESPEPGLFLTSQVGEIATEFAAQFCAIMRREPDWNQLAECGRQPTTEFSWRFLEESIDRDAAGFSSSADIGNMLAVPIHTSNSHPQVLVLVGDRLESEMLAGVAAVGRTLGIAQQFVESRNQDTEQIDRLGRTLKIVSNISTVRETEPLLELIAEEAIQLLDCDRASIFIWEPEHNQLVACPALGVDQKTLRIPADAGIVGQVIQTSQSICVQDAYNDARFDQSVDKKSGYKTDNLLCIPLKNSQGTLVGAFEVINKRSGDFSDEDERSLQELSVHAAAAFQNVQEHEQLARNNQQLTEQVSQAATIIGESPPIVALQETVGRLATTDLPVLILGESGTGKEVVAQSLHFQGPRKDAPFVAINCAALTETLLESELFGHEKGAFTDAHETREGKFELAERGTIFLDEIGDMSLNGQAKLLRVLEQKVITRVGGSQPIPINVRVVAATNTNLTEAVAEKRFREDLYYRLSVVTLELPPLRDRYEDVQLLSEFFLTRFCEQAGRKKMPLSADAKKRLQAHTWPGNVRELKNLMERIAFLTAGDVVEVDDLAFILSPAKDSLTDISPDLGLNEASKRFQQEYIRKSIDRVRGNMSEAAKILGLHRSNLYRKMRQLGMREGDEEE